MGPFLGFWRIIIPLLIGLEISTVVMRYHNIIFYLMINFNLLKSHENELVYNVVCNDMFDSEHDWYV